MQKHKLLLWLFIFVPNLGAAGIVGQPLLNYKYFISLSVPQRTDYIKEVLRAITDANISATSLLVPVEGTVIPEDYFKFSILYTNLENKNCENKLKSGAACDQMALRVERLTSSYQRFAESRRFIAEEDTLLASKPSRSIASISAPAAPPSANDSTWTCLESSDTSNSCVPGSLTVRPQVESYLKECKVFQPMNKHLICDDVVLHTCSDKGELLSGVVPPSFGRFVGEVITGGALGRKEKLGRDLIESIKLSTLEEIKMRVEKKHNVMVAVGTDIGHVENLKRVAIAYNQQAGENMCDQIAQLSRKLSSPTPQQICDKERQDFRSERLAGIRGATNLMNSNYSNYGSVISKCDGDQNPNVKAIQVAREGLDAIRMFPLSFKKTQGQRAELTYVDQGGQTQIMVIETSRDPGTLGAEYAVNGKELTKIIGVKTVAPCAVADASVIPATIKGSVSCGLLVRAQCGGQATCATGAAQPKDQKKRR
jgi:hypothetical protein